MKTFLGAVAVLLLPIFQNDMFAENKNGGHMKRMLCLGDSYTIGEAVDETERFPSQLQEQLHQRGIEFENPVIIAKTGWTTDELLHAIAEWERHPHDTTFDVVTLLIGVNNQYRGRPVENYRAEFRLLLKTALQYAGGKRDRVLVVSIPDWGVTPFAAREADQRSSEKIAGEIDALNRVNEAEAIAEKVHYIEITQASREAKQNHALLAEDGLHPSAKMYRHWADLLRAAIEKIKF